MRTLHRLTEPQHRAICPQVGQDLSPAPAHLVPPEAQADLACIFRMACAYLCGNRAAAEAVVEEAAFQVLSKRMRLVRNPNVLIASFCSLVLSVNDSAPATLSEPAPVVATLAHLPPISRLAVVLVDVGGLSPGVARRAMRMSARAFTHHRRVGWRILARDVASRNARAEAAATGPTQ